MTLPSPRALLRLLADAGVEHVVVGGIAVVFHGHVRTTEDLDIVPDPALDNLDRLVGVLQTEQATLLLAPARRFGDREAWLMRRGRNVSVSTSHGDLDVIRLLPGVPDYASLHADAVRFDIDGVSVAVASPEHLIAMKKVRDDERDRADVEALRILGER
jgi:predicted nucleotidyltransferase